MTLLIHAILRFTTALITDHCLAIVPHLRVTPHQTLPSLRTVELYIPLRRLRMTSVTFPDLLYRRGFLLWVAYALQFHAEPCLRNLCSSLHLIAMPLQLYA